jgi:hypothetical protein
VPRGTSKKTVTGAEKHLKTSGGKGAAKHSEARLKGGAKMHPPSTVSGAEKHFKTSAKKSALKHL